nr:WD40 repeat domain-containing protein [Deltaproteobacteria bacterium]
VPGQIAVDPACKRVALLFGSDPRKEVVALYDLGTGKRLRDIKHDALIGGVAWSRDGAQLLVGDTKGQLVRFAVATGKAVRKTKVSEDLVATVRVLPDGTTLIGGTSGAWLVRILDAKDAKLQELPRAGCSTSSETAISPDGNRIAVTCDRNTDIGVGTAVVIFQRQP